MQNDGYSQSTEGNVQMVQIVVTYNDGTSTAYYTFKTSGTFQIPSNTDNVSSVSFRVRSNNTGTSQAGSLSITKPMVAFGNQATSYISYQGQSY